MAVSEDVSVFLMSYNHGTYLRRAIEAVLTQTVRPRELLIVDDASTDDSMDIIEHFASRDPIIRVFRNPNNLGAVDSFNRHFHHGNGEYLINTSAADYLLPHMIERSMEMLRKHPQVGMSTSWPSVYSENTGKRDARSVQWSDKPRYFSAWELVPVLGPTGFASHSCVFKRSEYVKVGALRPSLQWHADWFHNLVVAFRSGVCYIPETLAWFRKEYDPCHCLGKDHERQQVLVVAEVIRTVLLPEFRDVLGFFRDSGVLGSFGAYLLKAASVLVDPRSSDVLRLADCLPDTIYAQFVRSPDGHLRNIADLYFGPLRHRDKAKKMEDQRKAAKKNGEHMSAMSQYIHALQRDNRKLHRQLELAKAESDWMRSSKFWKIRDLFLGLKKRIFGRLGRLVAKAALPPPSFKR